MNTVAQSEQVGKVISLDGDWAVIQVVGGGCGRCHEPGGCGGQQLTQMFCSSPRQFRLRNNAGARVGDLVTVVVPAGVLSRHATLGYGLPLLGLVSGALLGDGLAGNGGAVLGGAAGLFVAWWLMRRLAGKRTHEPYIGQIKSSGG